MLPFIHNLFSRTNNFLIERNVINSNIINDYVKSSLSDNIRSNNAKKWFISQLYNYIINRYTPTDGIILTIHPSSDFPIISVSVNNSIPTPIVIKLKNRANGKQYGILSLSELSNILSQHNFYTFYDIELEDWAINAIKEKTTLYSIIKLDTELTNHVIPNVIDYLNHITNENPNRDIRMRWEDAVTASNIWHDELAKTQTSSQFTNIRKKGERVVIEYDNGLSWVQLTSEQCLDDEGNLMGHCVGGDSYKADVIDGYTQIYSLRDSNNMPHVTIEVTDQKLKQIKGKGNKVPIPYYIRYVVDFLNKGIDDLFDVVTLYDINNANIRVMLKNNKLYFIYAMDIKDSTNIITSDKDGNWIEGINAFSTSEISNDSYYDEMKFSYITNDGIENIVIYTKGNNNISISFRDTLVSIHPFRKEHFDLKDFLSCMHNKEHIDALYTALGIPPLMRIITTNNSQKQWITFYYDNNMVGWLFDGNKPILYINAENNYIKYISSVLHYRNRFDYLPHEYSFNDVKLINRNKSHIKKIMEIYNLQTTSMLDRVFTRSQIALEDVIKENTISGKIGPHNNVELELMSQGKKPVAISPSAEQLPLFRKYAKQGIFIHQKIASVAKYKKIDAFALPKEAWRLKALDDIYKNIITKGKMDPQDHINVGRLLGYSDDDIRRFINKLNNGNTKSTVNEVSVNNDISANDENIYLTEMCHIFALALHYVYGYQMQILKDEYDGTIAHVFCVKNDRAIDISGIQSISSIKQKWFDLNDPVIVDTTPEELEYISGDDPKPLYPISRKDISEAINLIKSNYNKFVVKN